MDAALVENLDGFKSLALSRQQGIEHSRHPLPHEPQHISLDKILIAPKLTKLQYDMERLGLEKDEMIARYEMEGAPVARIVASHDLQLQALAELEAIFSPEQFVKRGEVNAERIADAQLVISFGGDNHFQFLAHAVGDGFILGINSDPVRSEGALVRYTVEDFPMIIQKLVRGEFLIEEWTQLEGTIDGKQIPMAISEYFVGEQSRLNMSRYTITINGKHEEQKSSGLIISTGAGSTGWYDSELQDLLPQGDIFARTSPEARVLVTSPYRGRHTETAIRQETLQPGDELVITSLNDSHGLVGCDSLEQVPFRFGAVARIKVSEKPLKVVRI